MVALIVALVGTGVAVSDVRGGGPMKEAREQLETKFFDRLAAELGITTKELRSALRSAGTKTIDDAVKAGLLTDEQAAALKERIAAGKFGLGFGPGLGWGHLKGNRGPALKGFGHGRWSALGALLKDEKARDAMGTAIGKKLGMSAAELRAAIKEDDKDLEDLMTAKGVTEESLGAAVAAAAKPHLDRLVKAGTIERADADEILAKMAEGAWIGKLARLSGLIGR
jgi:DNA-binding transcriptional MerR regulator